MLPSLRFDFFLLLSGSPILSSKVKLHAAMSIDVYLQCNKVSECRFVYICLCLNSSKFVEVHLSLDK